MRNKRAGKGKAKHTQHHELERAHAHTLLFHFLFMLLLLKCHFGTSCIYKKCKNVNGARYNLKGNNT